MAMLLMSVRTQLTNLHSLILELSQSWAGAGLAFAELAAMTQLTQLHIRSTTKVSAVLTSDCTWLTASSASEPTNSSCHDMPPC
jgi:hypothetical protein